MFISHAGEDKVEVARPLAVALMAAGLRVWLDEKELRLGDSLRAKIDEGLAQSRFGVLILSPSFFAKDWPQQELNGLVALESQSRKVVLPVWHGVEHDFVARFSAMLADRVAVDTRKGISTVAAEIVEALDPGVPGEAPTSSFTKEPRAPQKGYPGWLDNPRVRNGSLRITPILPTRCQQDEFRIVEVREYELVLAKSGTFPGGIHIPLSRLKDPLFSGAGQPVTLVLDGRLQWRSGDRDWKVSRKRLQHAWDNVAQDDRIKRLRGRRQFSPAERHYRLFAQ